MSMSRLLLAALLAAAALEGFLNLVNLVNIVNPLPNLPPLLIQKRQGVKNCLRHESRNVNPPTPLLPTLPLLAQKRWEMQLLLKKFLCEALHILPIPSASVRLGMECIQMPVSIPQERFFLRSLLQDCA
jgi:hypothetical protein